MELRIKRIRADAVSTLGELYVNGEFFCYTLEDADRFLETGGEKVMGQTAIPRGLYQLVLNESRRFERLLPLLINVPQFAGVRIHPGNTHRDTEGCILVGTAHSLTSDGHRVQNSRVIFDKLFELLQAAFDDKKVITIKVE